MTAMMAMLLVLVAVATGHQLLRLGLWSLTDLPTGRTEMWLYWPFHLAFLISAPLVHFPAFRWLRQRLGGTHPAAAFALAGALLAAVPMGFLKAWGDARLADLTTTEALLLCASQAASGFFLGAFYPALIRDAAKRRGE